MARIAPQPFQFRSVAVGDELAETKDAAKEQELIGGVGFYRIDAKELLEPRARPGVGDGMRQFNIAARAGKVRFPAEVRNPVRCPAERRDVVVDLRHLELRRRADDQHLQLALGDIVLRG